MEFDIITKRGGKCFESTGNQWKSEKEMERRCSAPESPFGEKTQPCRK
jgi:hypothetical protein